MKKLKPEVLKKTFKQKLQNNIKEIFDSKFTIFKSKCEELVQTLSVRYNKQIDYLQNELKTKNKIIDQLLKPLSSLTNIIHKLLDQTNIEEMTSILNLTLLITNLMKNIAARKLKNTLKETKQIIHRITLHPGM